MLYVDNGHRGNLPEPESLYVYVCTHLTDHHNVTVLDLGFTT